MTLCKEEGPRHPIFFTINKFKPQSSISSVLFGRVLLHRPRHFQLMELQSSSISGNPTKQEGDIIKLGTSARVDGEDDIS